MNLSVKDTVHCFIKIYVLLNIQIILNFAFNLNKSPVYFSDYSTKELPDFCLMYLLPKNR